MKIYICTKIISAVPVKMVNGVPWPEGLPLPKVPKIPETEDCCCNVGVGPSVEDGYMYTTSPDDKYPQFMSKDEFERMCRSAENMTFGDALTVLKRGGRVARKGWNGKGMYVFLADDVEFSTEADISEFENAEDGVHVSEVMVLRTAQGALQPGWLATQSDILADDWCIVE